MARSDLHDRAIARFGRIVHKRKELDLNPDISWSNDHWKMTALRPLASSSTACRQHRAIEELSAFATNFGLGDAHGRRWRTLTDVGSICYLKRCSASSLRAPTTSSTLRDLVNCSPITTLQCTRRTSLLRHHEASCLICHRMCSRSTQTSEPCTWA